MKDPWDTLCDSLDLFVADNVEIAWPVILKHIEEVNSGSLILDYGCGAGALCRELHHRGYVVIGVDTSIELLCIARQQSHRGITYIQGGNEVLKPYDGKLDAIVSVMVLHFIEDIEKLVAAMHAAVKQNGIVSITVFNPNFVIRCSNQFFRGLDTSRTPWTVKSQFQDVVIDTYIRTEAQYQQIFENAGFTFCSSQSPPFTKEFLEKNHWPLPSDVPEYLIMKFRKFMK